MQKHIFDIQELLWEYVNSQAWNAKLIITLLKRLLFQRRKRLLFRLGKLLLGCHFFTVKKKILNIACWLLFLALAPFVLCSFIFFCRFSRDSIEQVNLVEARFETSISSSEEISSNVISMRWHIGGGGGGGLLPGCVFIGMNCEKCGSNNHTNPAWWRRWSIFGCNKLSIYLIRLILVQTAKIVFVLFSSYSCWIPDFGFKKNVRG